MCARHPQDILSCGCGVLLGVLFLLFIYELLFWSLLFSKLLAEAGRGDAVAFAEGGDKVRRVVKAAEFGEFHDGNIAFEDNLIGYLQLTQCKPPMRRHTIAGAEVALEGRDRLAAHLRQLIDRSSASNAILYSSCKTFIFALATTPIVVADLYIYM